MVFTLIEKAFLRYGTYALEENAIEEDGTSCTEFCRKAPVSA